MKNLLDINNFIVDGFVKVCDVIQSTDGHWMYTNQKADLLYSPHRSWVYAICVDNMIVKIGETGNPLGIKHNQIAQPITGTRSRLGRYRKGCGTDTEIREKLVEEVANGRVSIWARKCETFTIETTVCGNKILSTLSIHKDLEMQYLDFIKQKTSSYPFLNKARK